MSVLESAKGGIRIRHRLGSPFVQEVETFGFLCFDAIAKCLAFGSQIALNTSQALLRPCLIRFNEESRRQSASDRAGDNREYSVEEVPQSGDVAHFDPETTAAGGFFPAFLRACRRFGFSRVCACFARRALLFVEMKVLCC
jgi:hypothetical protein